MECLIQITIKGRLVSNTRYSLNSYKIRLLIIDLGVMTTR